jgi:hypothetical protein
MTVKAKLTTQTVLRALHDLDYGRVGESVTTEDVCTYLKAHEVQVRPLLRELEAGRIVRRRQVNTRSSWTPWRGQNER